MVVNDWAVIPIRAHDAPGRGRGKAPIIHGWQRFAEYDSKLPTALDLAAWTRAADRAPGTGIPCGNVIGIDIDVLDSALCVEIEGIAFVEFGFTPLVRQGRRPKLLLVYRAAEPIRSAAYKALDGTGDGLDILAVGKQFVAYGLHPTTCKPYAWLRGDEPRTTSPDAAPAISAAQVDRFLERVRAILPLSKANGGKGKGGDSAEIVRDPEGFVIDGREAWLTRRVHQAGCELRLAAEDISADALTGRAWNLFADTTRLTVNGREWTRDDALTKAEAWLDRVVRGLLVLPPRATRIPPTYSDQRLSIEEAEAVVKQAVAEFFELHVPAWLAERGSYEAALAQASSL
jgi:hypothetical protein